MSGGVRNLRAMFENKEESSIPPPDRGRSPAGSIGGGSNGTSPRPLSKVRTSFVAVERSGQLGTQWGLRKEGSTDVSLATRRASFSVDEETNPKAVADKKQTINLELSARKNNTAITETIPESAIETPPINSEKRSGYLTGSSGNGKVPMAEPAPSANSDKRIPIEGRHTKPLRSDTASSVVAGGAASTNGGVILNGTSSGKLKPASPTKTVANLAPARRTDKPGPISTVPSSTTAKASSKSTKSPSNPKTPTTPAKTPTTPDTSNKPLTTKSHAKPADMKVVKPSVSSAVTSKPATRLTASSTVPNISEQKPLHSSPSNGLHKPKPRSPTRPANLPASMTAPTASSLSKVASSTAPSRNSLAPTSKTVSRSRSHASLSQKPELHHKSSRLDGDRPALGRPSTSSLKKQPSRPSLPKHTAPTDEGFLARMMRPTTSSASKTTEKIVTPPRGKVHTRPTTREGPIAHKLHQSLKGSPSTRKLPVVPRDADTDGPIMAPKGDAGGAMASAIGTNEPSTDKKEAISPSTTEHEPVTVSAHENQHIEEVLVKEGITLVPGSVVVTDDAEGANQSIEEASESVQTSSVESAVVSEDLKDSESSPTGATEESKEAVVVNELKNAVPPTEELGKEANRETMHKQAEEVEKPPNAEGIVPVA